MSITTKTGDSGETGLLFSKRIQKCHPRIVACGDVDEVNAAVGVAKAHLQGTYHTRLETIQNVLIALMGELATLPTDEKKYQSSKFDKLTEENVKQLEGWIDEIESHKLTIKGWALPGETIASSYLDFARSVCRRAERSVVSLNSSKSRCIVYLNRLSDLLWLM